LVIDEYQLLADPVRGTNYELILSLASAGNTTPSAERQRC